MGKTNLGKKYKPRATPRLSDIKKQIAIGHALSRKKHGLPNFSKEWNSKGKTTQKSGIASNLQATRFKNYKTGAEPNDGKLTPEIFKRVREARELLRAQDSENTFPEEL